MMCWNTLRTEYGKPLRHSMAGETTALRGRENVPHPRRRCGTSAAVGADEPGSNSGASRFVNIDPKSL